MVAFGVFRADNRLSLGLSRTSRFGLFAKDSVFQVVQSVRLFAVVSRFCLAELRCVVLGSFGCFRVLRFVCCYFMTFTESLSFRFYVSYVVLGYFSLFYVVLPCGSCCRLV